jgi:hypothetical protein
VLARLVQQELGFEQQVLELLGQDLQLAVEFVQQLLVQIQIGRILEVIHVMVLISVVIIPI